MNWGIKIVIGMAIAMTTVVATGIYMVTKNSDTLEENDYYEKGLSYDIAYQKKQNVNLNNAEATIAVERDSLFITFTDQINEGVIRFKRPSNDKLDRLIHFSTANCSYQMSLEKLKIGAWNLSLEWKNKHTSYLQEKFIYIK